MDIFDWEKIEKLDVFIKLSVWIVAAVLVFIAFKDSMRDTERSVYDKLDMLSELSENLAYLEEYGENAYEEEILYGTLCVIASDKGVKNLSIEKVKAVLTGEEEEIISSMAERIPYDGEDFYEVMTAMEERSYLVSYYGLSDAEVLFSIVNNHLEDLK